MPGPECAVFPKAGCFLKGRIFRLLFLWLPIHVASLFLWFLRGWFLAKCGYWVNNLLNKSMKKWIHEYQVSDLIYMNLRIQCLISCLKKCSVIWYWKQNDPQSVSSLCESNNKIREGAGSKINDLGYCPPSDVEAQTDDNWSSGWTLDY